MIYEVGDVVPAIFDEMSSYDANELVMPPIGSVRSVKIVKKGYVEGIYLVKFLDESQDRCQGQCRCCHFWLDFAGGRIIEPMELLALISSGRVSDLDGL